MKPRTCDPFAHVPAGAQVSIFAWQGRRDRCEGRFSKHFGEDHDAAKAYFAGLSLRADLSKVQVCAGWFDGPRAPQRRMDCRANGTMTIRERDLAKPSQPSRFADANIPDEYLSLLDDVA